MRYLNRHDVIVEYCRDKTVLDLGCIMHNVFKDRIEKGEWLHKKICEVAKYVVGLDYLKEHIPKLRKMGYNIIFGDVEHLEEVELNQKFDVIVCGELIEHLSNPGLFLEGIKRFMHIESKLIITTPNPFYYQRIMLLARGREEQKWLNPEHACWYSYQTLKQLLKRHNFQEVMYWYYGKDIRSFLGKILLRPIKNNPSFIQDGLLFIAKLKEDE